MFLNFFHLLGGGLDLSHDGVENDHDAGVEAESEREFHDGLELDQHTALAGNGLDAAEDGAEKGLDVHDGNNSKEGFAARVRRVGALQVNFGTEASKDDKNGNHWDKFAGGVGLLHELRKLLLAFLHLRWLRAFSRHDWFRTLRIINNVGQVFLHLDDELDEDNGVVQCNEAKHRLHGRGEGSLLANVQLLLERKSSGCGVGRGVVRGEIEREKNNVESGGGMVENDFFFFKLNVLDTNHQHHRSVRQTPG